MKKTGAWLTVYALEQLPITHTFGIPGVHNTEIYDELNNSNKIKPILVTHELGAAFIADGISRTSDSIGTLVVVPAAGVTHAMSGIGEAYLDGIPMLIISGGVRRDRDFSYQLHQMDQQKLMAAITKKTYLIERHSDIISTIFEAYDVATTGEPGPVHVEIPADIQLFRGEISELPTYQTHDIRILPDRELIKEAAQLLLEAKSPGIFLGWGARDCSGFSTQLAELLMAPVSTTLQGLSVFPANHPLHVGMGFSKSAIPAAEKAFRNCDCLIAVGTRFGEIPTGSFAAKVPDKLIHIDINPNVFNKNYPATISIMADAGEALRSLLQELDRIAFQAKTDGKNLRTTIQEEKQKYYDEWNKHRTDRVNPYLFFKGLRENLRDDAITVVDDGNHTFLAAELFPNLQSRSFICPTNFNSMGYAVPAAMGAQIANPKKQVVGVVGDGAFLMTCMEIITASTLKLGIVFFVFNDGELAQIAQGQEAPYNRKTCTILGQYDLEAVAKATGAEYLEIESNLTITSGISKALKAAKKGKPVIVDVKIDYSKQTRFTRGLMKTTLKKFSIKEKARFIGRSWLRKVTG
ncbi:MAG: acetolactate synthase large subunit [SAR324 cluster bacterium]|uniref:Acetolactate synthase large subunit n=1 Tax=SAR324 cluster bacterium TaxID=2024889 RepID=A0A2A4T730_9DELT|nr:MAG: acetolactate synthase large subunit [SAR324 cluster bacterium]